PGHLPGLRAVALACPVRQIWRLLVRHVYLRLPFPATDGLPAGPRDRHPLADTDQLRPDAGAGRTVVAPDRGARDEAQAPVRTPRSSRYRAGNSEVGPRTAGSRARVSVRS